MSDLNQLLLRQVSSLSGIPILVADACGNRILDSGQYSGEPGFPQTFFSAKHTITSSPWIDVIEQKCAVCGFSDGEFHYLLGPVLFREYANSEIWSLSGLLGIGNPSLSRIPCKTKRDLTAYLLCLYTAITGKTANWQDLEGARHADEVDIETISYAEEQYRLKNAEAGKFPLSYEESNLFIAMVKNGDLEQYAEYVPYLDNYAQDTAGTMALSSYKQCEYMAISMIVVVGRSMIDAGVNARKGLNMSDLAMQKIEKCRNEKEVIEVLKQFLLACIMEVRKQHEQQGSNTVTKQIKDYVLHHLNSRIVISDLARTLGYSPEHLSRTFREAEQMTIQQYILRERLKTAENMLKYSEQDISTICAYLQFSSQSHFTKAFRDFTGDTPGHYRQKVKNRSNK